MAVLAVGLALTGVAVVAEWRDTLRQEERALAEQGQIVSRQVAETIELGISKTRSVQAFFEASEEVTPFEFSRFAQYQGTSPGMVGIGYARGVPSDELAEFTRRGRLERPQYVVVDSRRRVITGTDGPRYHLPVWHSHLHEIVPPVLGVDLADDPVRREAIDRALTTNRSAVSDRVSVLGDPDGQYVEIYAPASNGTSGEPGVVFATIRLDDIIVAASDSAGREGTSIQLRPNSGGLGDSDTSGPFRWTHRIEVGDGEWLIELTRPERVPVTTLWILVLVGLIISCLAAVVTFQVSASRRRQQELAEIVRMTGAKDVFLASVAHELRTPLTSVVGATALLKEDWASLSAAETEELLTVAHSEATDLGDLVEDLLVAGRLEAGAIHYRAEAVNLAREVNRVVVRINPTNQVEIASLDEGPLAHADPLRVRQIVRNLVVNAVRHAHAKVAITATDNGETVNLAVSNDGDPIPPHLVDVLFRPYQEGRDRPGGHASIGLGLPISQRLADAMGGALTYSYRAGWCTFTLRLPSFNDDTPEDQATDAGSVLAPHTSTQVRSEATLG